MYSYYHYITIYVHCITGQGDPAEEQDYSINSNTFTFTAGAITDTTSVCNTLSIAEDNFIEDTEVLGVEISSISMAGITFGVPKNLSFFDTSKFSNLNGVVKVS